MTETKNGERVKDKKQESENNVVLINKFENASKFMCF